MFLFMCVSIMVMALDWKRIRKSRAVPLLLPGLIGAFSVNILRVYVLIVVGVLISPGFAIGLFHSYIGSLLFLVYALVFLKVFYKTAAK